MGKKITIEIKDGEITVTTTGFQGRSCISEMKKIGELTGMKPEKIKMTSDAYQATSQKRGVELDE